MNTITRRQLVAALALAGASLVQPAMAQADFPNRPIKIVIPLPAGGAADGSVRTIAVELEAMLKQPVIVENKPGGLFQIGVQAVSSAPADGYTLLYIYSGMVSTQAIQKRFDLARDFDPVAPISESPTVLAVAGTSRFKTARELIDFGRANPGKLTYSTLGSGSLEDLKSYEFIKAAGMTAMAVPYKGGPDAVKALIGNEVDFIITPAIFGVQFAPKGQMKVLAAMDSARLSMLPDVPTLKEAGLDVPPFRFWTGILAKAGTPPAVVQRLSKAFAEALTKPPVLAHMTNVGGRPHANSQPEALRQRILSDVASFGELARHLNLRAE